MAEENLKVNIMMFGGRRCGKTSVIAAMKSCFSSALGSSSDLVISITDPDTMYTIDEKANEIEGYFANKTRGITMDASGSSTSELNNYELQISVKNKKGCISLNMCDYPGEWFIKKDADYKTHQDTLAEVMKNSHIIMIAIDTPYLMEHTLGGSNSPDDIGQYNDKRNFCKHLSNMVKNHFKPKNDGYRHFSKMIMFVPLKCETYYGKGQMELVKARIKTAYKEVFDYVSGSNSPKYEVLITPIFTFGEKTVKFSRFERKDGEIITDKLTGIPSQAKYMFVDMKAKYTPKFCEQPLLYSLAYMLKMYEFYKKAEINNESWIASFFRNLKEIFGNWATLEDFQGQRKLIMSRIKKDGDGYEVCQDPLQFDI